MARICIMQYKGKIWLRLSSNDTILLKRKKVISITKIEEVPKMLIKTLSLYTQENIHY
jgi:hypothetical protein